jgi:hypothetical protein
MPTRLRRFVPFAALAVLASLVFAMPARAQGPSGTIQIELFKAGFIVGVSGGSGTLYFQGNAYPLSIGGVSLGATIGASSADLIGEVYNLQNPYDIQGIYSATESGYAVAGGEGAALLQNTRGVELHLRGKKVGLEFSMDLSGMAIELQ